MLFHRNFCSRTASALLGVFLSFAAASTAFAQTDAGALRVLVTDESQAIVPGATVEVINAATNVRMNDVSDASGYATFAPVPRGIYTVKVTLEGFRAVETSNVRVDVNERRFLSVSLAVVTTTETVEVVSKDAVIQTEEGSPATRRSSSCAVRK